MKLVSVVGARPQFIKASAVSRAISKKDGITETIIHTGQHFDTNMSDIFFRELDIPAPSYNLEVAGLSHGAMTGRMLERIEEVLKLERPDKVLVYGDTNSTLAAALAASKLGIQIGHVESGLRSFNFHMPEEINRILTDRVSSQLFCPSESATRNLLSEGFPFLMADKREQQIFDVGDVMFDMVKFAKSSAFEFDLSQMSLAPKGFALCTLHRQENIIESQRFLNILAALMQVAATTPVVFPVHPRTLSLLKNQHQEIMTHLNLHLINPVGYFEMQSLQRNSICVFTDSGGVQKEAFFNQVPCITLRDETEWIETVEAGWNVLAGSETESILSAWNGLKEPNIHIEDIYGDGRAAERIVEKIIRS